MLKLDKKNKLPLIAFILGLIFIIAVSLILGGFAETFRHMIEHIKFDIFQEGWIHVYIAGWILIIYAIIKFATGKSITI